MALTLEAAEKKRAYQQAHYQANKEKIKARAEAYRAANKEKVAVYRKAYYQANKEKVAVCRKAYYAANKEKIAARSRRSPKRVASRAATAAKAPEVALRKMTRVREYYAKNKERIALVQRTLRATEAHKKKSAAALRRRQTEQRCTLDDAYIRALFRMSKKEVPPELVAAKKLQLQIYRKLKGA